MKNFFKKLALVLALALVVTVVAPAAASKSEAASLALTATKKTIGVGSSYDFNIKNKVKGSTYKWTSSNTKVATVNSKNGLTTAKAEGTAKISVKITLPKKAGTKTLTATVTVKKYVDATSVKISNPVDTIKLGSSHDFNRTMSPEGANNKTYWIVKDAAGKEVANTRTGAGAAIMNSKGVFKPAEGGTYTITAECWRSKTATVKRAESEALKVTVVPDFEAKQDSDRSFTVAFAQDMSKILKPSNFKVENAATHAPYAVKEVKFSKDGKTATVVMFTAFADKAEYQVTYTNGDVTATDKFMASVGAVDHIVIKTQTVVFSTPTDLEFALMDANGIDVTATYNVNNRVDVEAKTSNGYLSGGKLTLFARGNTAEITVTYHTYTFDATGKENVVVQKGLVTAVDPSAITLTGVKYTLGKNPADWSNFTPVTSIPVEGKTNLLIYVENSEGKRDSLAESTATYQSSDPSIININASTGAVYAAKEGTAFIIVTLTKGEVKYQYTLPVTVTAKSKATTMSLTPDHVTISNTAGLASKTVKVVVKDQYGNEMASVIPTVTPLNRPNDVNDTDAAKVVTAGDGSLTITATDAKKGTYTFKISAKVDGVELINILTITVTEISGDTVVYQVEKEADVINTTFTDDLTVDKAKELADKLGTTGYTIKVAEYKGAGIEKYDATALYRVLNDKGEVVFSDDLTTVNSSYAEKISDFFTNTSGTLTVKGIKLNNTDIEKKLAAGVYTVQVYANNAAVKQETGFSVADTQAPVALVRNKEVETVIAAENATLEKLVATAFTKDDTNKTAIKESDIVAVTATNSNGAMKDSNVAVTANETITVISVVLKVTIAGYTVPVTCPVNVSIPTK